MILKLLTSVRALIALTFLFTYDSVAQPAFDGVVRQSREDNTKQAYLPTLFASSHASNLHVVGNGDLLCVWFSGSDEGKSNVAIAMSRLPRGERQWSEPMKLSQQIGRSAQNPVLFSSSGARLLLFHTSQIADEGQKNSEVRILHSEDNGRTWSTPRPLFQKAGAFVRHPLIIGQKKEWLFPMYYTPADPTNGEKHYSVVAISSDQGETWTEYPMPRTQGLVQPSVVRLSDKRLLAYFRSRYADWIFKSVSIDDGRTWSVPEKTALPNNNSSFQLTRLKNGHLVLAFNNVQAADQHEKIMWRIPRSSLSVALSTDEGVSWPWVRDVQLSDAQGAPNPEYSYPSITQTSDGNLHLTYTYLRKTIKYVQFTEDWIKKGSTAGFYRPGTKAQASLAGSKKSIQ